MLRVCKLYVNTIRKIWVKGVLAMKAKVAQVTKWKHSFIWQICIDFMRAGYLLSPFHMLSYVILTAIYCYHATDDESES